MIGGELLDLSADGRFKNQESPPITAANIVELQIMKTGKLIAFSCEAPAILASAHSRDRNAARRFGEAVGQSFQIVDDLIDVEGNEQIAGKRLRKDTNKATFVRLFGADTARQRLAMLLGEAETCLDEIAADTSVLRLAAHHLASRVK